MRSVSSSFLAVRRCCQLCTEAYSLMFRISSRLKGCESEVAALLDEQWKGTTVDWISLEDANPIDGRRLVA